GSGCVSTGQGAGDWREPGNSTEAPAAPRGALHQGQAGTGPPLYLLYDKVYRADILAHAYALSKQKGGAPGADGVTVDDMEAGGLERWLAAVGEALRTETYRPQPVRRVLIPKPGGTGERPLGIPVIWDRVVQTAALLILQPIFEADLEPTAYGYRPGRTALE